MGETEFIPGSRTPVAPPAGLRDVLEGRKGEVIEVGGKEVELFTIGQLGFFLGRKPQTIRKWERNKIIPRATFVKPGSGGDVRGKRRLYSRAQVEALVEAARQTGILHDLHRQVSKTDFTARVYAAFRKIAEGN